MIDAKMDKISILLASIRSRQDTIQHEVIASLRGGVIFSSTLYTMGAYKRFQANTSAFLQLIESRNYAVAAAVLRMQIDVAVRLFGLSLVHDPDAVCLGLINGERYDKFKDRNKNRLQDAYLVREIGKQAPWIPRVYERTSGFIHLSEKHLFSSVAKCDDEGLFSLALNSDRHIPGHIYEEICEAFVEASDLAGSFILQIFQGSNPAHRASHE